MDQTLGMESNVFSYIFPSVHFAFQSNSKIIVAGNFTSLGGAPINKITRLMQEPAVITEVSTLFYPNPATDWLHLNMTYFESGEPVQVKIIDLLGRPVAGQSFTGKSDAKISLATLVHGQYLVSATDSKRVYWGRFIKE